MLRFAAMAVLKYAKQSENTNLNLIKNAKEISPVIKALKFVLFVVCCCSWNQYTSEDRNVCEKFHYFIFTT